MMNWDELASANHEVLQRLDRSIFNEIWLQSNFHCEYCGVDLLSNLPVLDGADSDHLLPKAKYPHLRNVLSNYVMTCASCHKLKGKFDPAQDDTQFQTCTNLTETDRNELINRVRERVKDRRQTREQIRTSTIGFRADKSQPKRNMRAETHNACPFCALDSSILQGNQFALAVCDNFPVSNGHTLIVPRRHVRSFFDLNDAERNAAWELAYRIRDDLCASKLAEGFNVGINDGEAAGQTVMHAHIHVIPRWKHDVTDPRGGVRWVLPEKAKYWNDK